MGYFPLFINLSGKEVLVAGGGKVAERKVRILLEFDAAIRLVSPETIHALRDLADSGAIRLLPRKYRAEDVDTAALVIAATCDRTVNRQIHDDALRKCVPVNVVDDPELCTFFFPAVVHRTDFVVGITTSGSYPALAKYARQQIETLFPEQYGEITNVLKEYRKKIWKEIQSPAQRAAVLEGLIDTAAHVAKNDEILDRRILIEQLDKTCGKLTQQISELGCDTQ
ncbi:MAG: sirohydrochlorin ferrochelatase [Mahella sp.]|nr:sirohydrochlorin ferrochelatase [Mahella sp.]